MGGMGWEVFCLMDVRFCSGIRNLSISRRHRRRQIWSKKEDRIGPTLYAYDVLEYAYYSRGRPWISILVDGHTTYELVRPMDTTHTTS